MSKVSEDCTFFVVVTKQNVEVAWISLLMATLPVIIVQRLANFFSPSPSMLIWRCLYPSKWVNPTVWEGGRSNVCVCVWNNLVFCFPEVFQQTKLYFIKKSPQVPGWLEEKERDTFYNQCMENKTCFKPVQVLRYWEIESAGVNCSWAFNWLLKNQTALINSL